MDKQKKRLSLNLNKEVITQLDKAEAAELKGGDLVFLSLFGSNCYNTNPNAHNCCTGKPTTFDAACNSAATVNNTAMPGTCCCNPKPPTTGNPGGGTGTGTGTIIGTTTNLSLNANCQH